MEGCRDSDDKRCMAASKEDHCLATSLLHTYLLLIFTGACLSGIAVHEPFSSAYLIEQ